MQTMFLLAEYKLHSSLLCHSLAASLPMLLIVSCPTPPHLTPPHPLVQALFRLVEYNVHSNVLVLRNVATLSDILNSQGYVRDGLHGEGGHGEGGLFQV